MREVEYNNYKNFITIVIPVYNGENYIKRTIDTLKNQTYKNFEVIFIDDCSKDNSVEIIKKNILDDNRFRLVQRTKNFGTAVKNIEDSMKYCNGEYFFYMSQDDLIDSDFFEKCIQKAEQTGADTVLPNMIYYYPNMDIKDMSGTFPPDKDYNKVLDNIEAFKLSIHWKIHAFHLKKTSILKKLNWNSDIMPGDEVLNRMYFYNSNKIVFVDTNFYYNQDNDAAITRAVKPHLIQYVDSYIRLVEFLINHKKEFDKPTIDDTFKYTMFHLKDWSKILGNNYSLLSKEQKEILDLYYKSIKIKMLKTAFKLKKFNYIYTILKHCKARKDKVKKDFILIFANIPTVDNEKDGMIQREIAIDNILNFKKRIYVEKVIDVKFLKHPKKYIKSYFSSFSKLRKLFPSLKDKKVKVYPFIKKSKLRKLMKKADKIYVHSLLKFMDIPMEYIEKFSHKMVLDIHGCVVEEFILDNADEDYVARISKIEWLYRKLKALVAVSENMIDFYKNKYEGIETKFIKLPIFTNNMQYFDKKYTGKLNIIYSGGVHYWQNVDLMVESISKIIDKFDIAILSPNVDVFNKKICKYNILDKITLKSVPSSEIYKEYENAHLGYVLRDDIIVNKVSCPTKIIEYMTSGIIPVVLQPEIGDFNRLGYSYILNDDLIKGKLPTAKELKQMAENNYKIIEKLEIIQRNGRDELKNEMMQKSY